MTENEAKAKYEALDSEMKEKYLQAARTEKLRDGALAEWQKTCSHNFSEPCSVYGYGLARFCKKCNFEIRS